MCYQAGHHCGKVPRGACTSGFRTQGERELGYLYTNSSQSCLRADAGGCLVSETEATNAREHRTRDTRSSWAWEKRSALGYKKLLLYGSSAYADYVKRNGNSSYPVWKAIDIGRKGLFRTKLKETAFVAQEELPVLGGYTLPAVCTAARQLTRVTDLSDRSRGQQDRMQICRYFKTPIVWEQYLSNYSAMANLSQDLIDLSKAR